MRHWGRDILLDRRRLIACAAGLLVACPVLAALPLTPPQTAGPFYPRIKPKDSDADLSVNSRQGGRASGDVIDITGRILSARGGPIENAVVEIWQADAGGQYLNQRNAEAAFQGYGAVNAGRSGSYRFRTIRPGAYGSGSFQRTPHIHFRVVTEAGQELVTQMYFPGQALNETDVVLVGLGDDAARAAATARTVPGQSPAKYEFDLVLA